MPSPAVLANNTVFKLGGTDLSGDLNQVKLNLNQAEIDVSVFGITGWKEWIPSISDATLDVTGFFNKATGREDAALYALFGAPASPTAWEIDVPNSSVGSVKYTGNAWGRTYPLDARVNDAVKFTSALRITAAVTRALL